MSLDTNTFLKPRTQNGFLKINNALYSLYEGLNTIGRNKNASVIIKDESVSQHHAMVTCINGKHYVSDVQSFNGTYLNHDKLQPLLLYELKPDCNVQFATVSAVFKKNQSSSQNVDTAIETDTQGCNDSIFFASTQKMFSTNTQQPDVCFDDGYNFEGIHYDENQANTSTAISIHDLPTQIIDHKARELESEANFDSNNHELPTQIFDNASDDNNKQLSELQHNRDAVQVGGNASSKKKSPENVSTSAMQSKNQASTSKTVSIHDLPTQIIDYDARELKTDFDCNNHELPTQIFDQCIDDNNKQLIVVNVRTSAIQSEPSQGNEEEGFVRDNELEHNSNTVQVSGISCSMEKPPENVSTSPVSRESMYNLSTEFTTTSTETENNCDLPTQVEDNLSKSIKSCSSSNKETRTRISMVMDSNSLIDVSDDFIDVTLSQTRLDVSSCNGNLNKEIKSIISTEDLDTVKHLKKKCMPLPPSCETVVEDNEETTKTSEPVSTINEQTNSIGLDSETDDDLDLEIPPIVSKILQQEDSQNSLQSTGVTHLKKKCKPLTPSLSPLEDNAENVDTSHNVSQNDKISVVRKRKTCLIIESDSETDDDLEIPEILNKIPGQENFENEQSSVIDIDILKCHPIVRPYSYRSESDTDIEADTTKSKINCSVVNSNSREMSNDDVIIPATQMSDNDDNDFDFMVKQNSTVVDQKAVDESQESFSLRLSSYFTESEEADKTSSLSMTLAANISDKNRNNTKDVTNDDDGVSNMQTNSTSTSNEMYRQSPAPVLTKQSKAVRNQNNIAVEPNENNSIIDLHTQATSSKFNQEDIFAGYSNKINLKLQQDDSQIQSIQPEISGISMKCKNHDHPMEKVSEDINSKKSHAVDHENKDICVQPIQNIPETGSNNQDIEDDVFNQPTQMVTNVPKPGADNQDLNDDIFDQPTQIVINTLNIDKKNRDLHQGDIFDQPTQMVRNVTKPVADNQDLKDDIFDQPTQIVVDTFNIDQKLNTKDLNQDDIFDQPTQPVMNPTTSKSNTVGDENDIFLQPTQEVFNDNGFKQPKLNISAAVESRSSTESQTVTELSANCKHSSKLIPDEDSDVFFQPTQLVASKQSENEYNKDLGLSIESQLEILFSSQQPLEYIPATESRPSNPLASVLETINLYSSVDKEDSDVSGSKISTDKENVNESMDKLEPIQTVNLISESSSLSNDESEDELNCARSKDKKTILGSKKSVRSQGSKFSKNNNKNDEDPKIKASSFRSDSTRNKKEDPVLSETKSTTLNSTIIEDQETSKLRVNITRNKNLQPRMSKITVRRKSNSKNKIQEVELPPEENKKGKVKHNLAPVTSSNIVSKNVIQESSRSTKNNTRELRKLKRDSGILISDSGTTSFKIEFPKAEEKLSVTQNKKFKPNKKQSNQIEQKIKEQAPIEIIHESSEDELEKPNNSPKSKLRKRKETNLILTDDTPTKKLKLDTSTSSSDYSTTSVEIKTRSRRELMIEKKATNDNQSKLNLKSSASSNSRSKDTSKENKEVKIAIHDTLVETNRRTRKAQDVEKRTKGDMSKPDFESSGSSNSKSVKTCVKNKDVSAKSQNAIIETTGRLKRAQKKVEIDVNKNKTQNNKQSESDLGSSSSSFKTMETRIKNKDVSATNQNTIIQTTERLKRAQKNVNIDIVNKKKKQNNSSHSDLESSGSSSSTVVQTPVNKFITNSTEDTPTRNKRKLKPKVVFTMLDSPELESVIRSLGGTVVDNLNASTVLVTQSLKRSQKLLSAVGQGKPICSPKWLHESKKANTFLDPWDFILEDKEAEAHWKVSLRESLQRSQNNKLLANYKVHLLVTNAVDVLKGAIESCGGKCVAKVPAKNATNFIIVSTVENKTKHVKFSKVTPSIPIVAPEAIFDGVLRQELHFEDHLIV